jgi:hypothetical protein
VTRHPQPPGFAVLACRPAVSARPQKAIPNDSPRFTELGRESQSAGKGRASIRYFEHTLDNLFIFNEADLHRVMSAYVTRALCDLAVPHFQSWETSGKISSPSLSLADRITFTGPPYIPQVAERISA